MRSEERQDPADAHGDEVEKPEELEDLEANEDEAAHIKGGGPKNEAIQSGSGPEDLR